jgi:hypothetical protein
VRLVKWDQREGRGEVVHFPLRGGDLLDPVLFDRRVSRDVNAEEVGGRRTKESKEIVSSVELYEQPVVSRQLSMVESTIFSEVLE